MELLLYVGFQGSGACGGKGDVFVLIDGVQRNFGEGGGSNGYGNGRAAEVGNGGGGK